MSEQTVTLTKQEAENLENHLEWYIIQEIRDFGGVYDNLEYLANLIHIWERCKEVSE